MDEVEPEPKPGKYPSLDDILREEPEPQFLLPCTICNKTFNPESLQRHSKICEKNATRKRKQFDSFKQRVQGTGMAEFLSLTTVKKEKPSSPRKTVNSWKEKHEAFVSAIRAARGSDSTNDKPVLCASGDGRAPVRNSDHEQCPYCARSFGPKAFDRHIEWCREHRQRQPPSAASLQARERLEARIKYRAPPCKSKRSLMREKYSPLAQRKNREQSPSSSSVMSASVTHNSMTGAPVTVMVKSFSAGSQKTQSPDPPVRSNRTLSSTMNRTQRKENANNQGLNRGGISRTSIRASQRASQRSVSPKKPVSPASTKSSKSSPYRPSSRASDRRSDESLDLLLATTETPVLNRNPSNMSLSTKRKSQSNEKSSAQQPPQIISKTEPDRSRRNSVQRLHHSPPPESPPTDPFQQVRTVNLFQQPRDHDVSPIASIDRDSSRERLSEQEDSTTPYLLSDSSCTGVADAKQLLFKDPVAFIKGASSGRVVRKKQLARRDRRRMIPDVTAIPNGICRKRRRISTPGTPLSLDVYQARTAPANLLEFFDFRGGNDVDFDDNLSAHFHGDDGFDVDPSSDDEFRGKRGSCSASTYTKDRSSFVDGVLRDSSSERDLDLSEFSAIERISSPVVTSQGSNRKHASVKWTGKLDARTSAKKTESASLRKIAYYSQTPSPNESPRCRAGVKSDQLKLPPLAKIAARNPDRKMKPSLAVRTVAPEAAEIPPTLQIKNKIPHKLKPLSKGDREDMHWSVVSESQKSEVYDPYQSAERQMFELFNSDSAADLSVAAENLKNEEKHAPSSSRSISPSHSPSPCPPLETSPTSAFTRYSKESEPGVRTPSPAPAPPPRQHRSVSVELPSLTGPPRPPLQTHHSVDAPLEALVEVPFLAKRNSDERPRTYDIYCKDERQLSPVSSLKDDSSPDILVVVDTPLLSPPISPPPEFVELRERPVPKAKESRESREVCEITDHDPSDDRVHSPLSQKLLDLSDEISIDNLMEEVARMQQYVSLMSNTSQSRPKHQSAKSRRSRANKLLIEDYLYPADSPMRGTTPIMGDVCNPVLDLNGGSDNEDNDVVVSPNALSVALKSEIRPRGDVSPVLSKDLSSFSPDSSRSARLSVEALAFSDARRRLPGDSDEDEVISAQNSPVTRTASNRQSTGSRLSGDSAYSSLNRKSPIPSAKVAAPVRPSRQIRNASPPSLLSQSLQAESLNQSRGLSSSSSESSLHAMSTSLTSRKSLESDAASKLSKFCHECGTKFPVSSAKFCPECGIRRLGM